MRRLAWGCAAIVALAAGCGGTATGPADGSRPADAGDVAPGSEATEASLADVSDRGAADEAAADPAGPEAGETGVADSVPDEPAVEGAPEPAPEAAPEVLPDAAVDVPDAAGDLADAADAADAAPETVLSPTACNGLDALCDRRYDQVSHPTSHNSMSNADEGWGIPNQNHGISRQLQDGIRGLMLDTHYWTADTAIPGAVYLCHEICELGNELLTSGLGKVKAFLDSHPREVVTIIFESYVSAADTAACFHDAGLDDSLYALPDGAAWPTLRQMIDSGKRVVVMTDSGGGDPAWYMDEFSHVWENPWSAKTAADLSCRLDRGNPANPLFVMDNMVANPFPLETTAATVNSDPFFLDHALQCRTESGRLPNFPTVDYYDVGNLFDVTAALNALPPLD